MRSDKRAIIKTFHQRHPPFAAAVMGDLHSELRSRGDHRELTRPQAVVELTRLLFATDAFGALLMYRLKTWAQRRGIPVLPRLAHRAAMSWAQLSIGDPVIVQPGVRFPHGQVVVDGFVHIHEGVLIRPFVTIGLLEGVYEGPTIHRNAEIGTGAKILGPVTIGEGAKVGANAVVLHSVPAGAVAVGIPARVVEQ